MKVQLLTCSNSPQCLSTKMFLDMRGVIYEDVEVTDEEMNIQGFVSNEMPVLLIDDEIEMIGFDASKLNEIFK